MEAQGDVDDNEADPGRDTGQADTEGQVDKQVVEQNGDPESETQRKQKAQRDREPLLFCKLISEHPAKTFLLTLCCHLAMVLLTAILFASGYNIVPVYFDDLPLHLHNEPWQARVHAFNEKTAYPSYYDRVPNGGFRAQMSPLANIDLYYEMKDKSNVFTKETLVWMEQLENELVNAPKYDQYCQVNVKTGRCTEPVSILRYFDGTFRQINSTFYDPTYENIEEVLLLAATHPDTNVKFAFFLGTDSSVTKDGVYSPITRSIIPFGFPMQQYLGDTSTYRKTVGEYTGLNMEQILLSHMSIATDNFQFVYRSQAMWFYFSRTQAFRDIYFAGASFAFIFCLMLIHTRSLWVTSFAIMSVASSFLIANLIYNLVFQFHYLGFFHILSLFIVLGIGADDFFVFYDTWRNTGSEDYISTAHRLSDTYRKSSISMLFTSLTTSVAFFANTISPLLATRSFGLFSGIVVIVNYLSVITFFPTVVSMYYTYFASWQWPCFRICFKRRSNSNVDPESATQHAREKEAFANKQFLKKQELIAKFVKIDSQASTEFGDIIDEDEEENGIVNDAFNKDMDASENKENVKETLPGEEINEELNNHGFKDTNKQGQTSDNPRRKKPWMATFFRDQYFLVVSNKYLRWLILVVMAVILGVFIFQASKLEADNEMFGVLPDDHQYAVARRHKLESFMASYGDETLELYMIWGLRPNDMSGCQFSEPECDGEKVIDHTFDPNSEASQRALKGVCDTLENMGEARANLLRLRKNPNTKKYEIRCFLHNMDNFLQTEQDRDGRYLDFPYTQDKVLHFMRDRPQFYNVSSLGENFTDYLEIPISYWLYNKNTFDITDDFKNFDSLIGEQQTNYSLPLNNDKGKLYANKLRYIAIEVNTTIKYSILGHYEGIPIRDEWEKFMAEELAKMPDGLKNGFQTDKLFKWHRLSVQKILIENAINGLIIGVCVAFPILVISTGNIIVGALATFTLCACTVCVIGVIPLGGWKLGALESLNMCMVVGLSVDYVVHLAQAYSSSLHNDRLSRTRDMLDEMATSVLFGAITTLGAALFMFFTVLSFFKQFATFLFATIGFSLVFSLCMFTTLMTIMGPQKNVGNLKVLFRKCFRKEE